MKIKFQDSVFQILNSTVQGPTISFETESIYSVIDLLSEGPIEGFVNSDGYAVNYIGLEQQTDATLLGQGVYYNDIPFIDKKTNFYNFSAARFNASFGTQFKNGTFYASTIYRYKTKIFDYSYAIINKYKPKLPSDLGKNGCIVEYFNDDTENDDYKNYISYKNIASVVSHSVQNKYSDYFEVNVSVDNLYNIGGNNVVRGQTAFIISVDNKSSNKSCYAFFNGSFVAKGGAVVLPFYIVLDYYDRINNPFPEFTINIYSLRGSVSGSITENRTISLDSVVEYLLYPLSHPYSVIVNNTINSKHFNDIPVRSYDCKLLKIRVPDNYDGEVREYINDWSGNFSRTLKWTNNPAWIFYDLCTNSRYGMAKGQIKETDLNKWQILTLSKYCDELVKTDTKAKFESDFFYYNNELKVDEKNYNCIYFNTSMSQADLELRYPVGSLIYLYDLKDKFDVNIEYNYKKLICSVVLSGSTAILKLCDDFGPRKIIEQDINSDLYKSLLSYIKNAPEKNTEENIKLFILNFLNGTNNLNFSFKSEDLPISRSHMNRKIFDKSLNVRSGYCVAKHPEYQDFLEPRFSCNVLINSESEGLKALSDLSSIFRGIFYFKNGLLSLTSDVKQNVVYIFTNSNVKDGLFTYASSDLNTSFSVAKVPYLDKYDNFKDKVLYIEDADLVRKFGVVEKEILSFGITSRSEARRIGKWYLATGKLESEVVGFNAGVEATLLQVGNVIRISDSLKNSSIIYGKIIGLDFENSYIFIDREISQNCLGKIIKIFSILDDEVVELNYSIVEIDNVNLKLKIISEKFFSWMVVDGITISNDNKTLTSKSSLSANWNKKTFTNQYYIENCQISFTIGDILSESAIGLSKVNNINTSYTDIEYRFRFNGSDFVIESNNSIIYSAFGIATTQDIFTINYDGKYIRYYRNKELLASTQRSVRYQLYGVVALKSAYASINNLYFTNFPDLMYGKYSELRSGANFSIYINDDEIDDDLFKIISINEVSSNEYAVSAMKYAEEKFDIIDKNIYIEKNQNNKKEIVFSSDSTINELFSSSEINSSSVITYSTVNYATAESNDYDYSFYIEQETLNENYLNAQYQSVLINFNTLFTILINRGANNVHGLMCVINRNAKTLSFNILKENQKQISVFLGETQSGNFIYKTSLDFYAFDQNYKIINV